MSRYLAILKIPAARGLLISSTPARLAYGMISLSIYFKVQQTTGSISVAGLAVGLNAAAGSITAGLRSSLIDRVGLRIPLRVLTPLFALSVISFNQIQNRSLLLFVSFIFGLVSPPINLTVRPLWKFVVPEELQRATFAVDTAVMSVAGVVGPVLATTLALSSHPTFALNVCGVLMLIGGISLALQKVGQDWVPEKKVKGAGHILKLPAIRMLIIEGIFIGFGTGAFEIGIPALTTTSHVQYRTGWFFGTLAATNIIGSLLAGLISKRRSPLRAFRVTYLFWVLVSLPLAFCNPDWTLLIITALLGLFIGAQMVFYWEIVEAVRPQGSAAGAIGWLWTFEGTAASIGTMVNGLVSQHFSARLALAIYSMCIIGGYITTRVGFKYLAAADRLPTQEEDDFAVKTNIDKNSEKNN